MRNGGNLAATAASCGGGSDEQRTHAFEKAPRAAARSAPTDALGGPTLVTKGVLDIAVSHSHTNLGPVTVAGLGPATLPSLGGCTSPMGPAVRGTTPPSTSDIDGRSATPPVDL